MNRETGTPGSTIESELKAFAKDLVYMFSLGADAARFSVVSFAENATKRVPFFWRGAGLWLRKAYAFLPAAYSPVLRILPCAVRAGAGRRWAAQAGGV